MNFIPAKIKFAPVDFIKILEDVMRGDYDPDIPILYKKLTLSPEDTKNIDITFLSGVAIKVWSSSRVSSHCGLCEWCNDKIDGKVYGVPVNIDGKLIDKSLNNKYLVQEILKSYGVKTININLVGCFCSYQCAYASLLACSGGNGNKYFMQDVDESIKILKLLFMEHNKGKENTLYPMPSPLLKEKYGGMLSDEEYNKFKTKECNIKPTNNFETVNVSYKWLIQ